jgi:ferredoxin
VDRGLNHVALEIRIDDARCRGAQACVRRAPRTFSLGADGKSRAAASPTDDEETIRVAAAACPFFAINVRGRPTHSDAA